LAVALGNAPREVEVGQALQARLEGASPLLAEHIIWALQQHDTLPADAAV
jgi:epoxyqueuosine reductase